MATKVLVPRMGEGVDELTVAKWLKKEGDPVKELEPLLEVETDKVVTEIPSPVNGVILKIVVPENTTAHVGEVMAWIGQAQEAIPINDSGSSVPLSKETSTMTGTISQMVHEPGKNKKTFLSPVVRKIAVKNNVDISALHGTGLNGRITRQDIITYLARSEEVLSAGKNAIGTHDTLRKVTTIRQQIADRMLQSRDTSPQVLTVMEADMSRVVAHRATNKVSFATEGVNLTYTAYFIAAIASGLEAFPLVNSSWVDQGILVHGEINVGMATSLGEEGLIVPVLHHADELSLLGIARAANDLSGRARSKKLKPEEVKGGTFTLTNHGISGSLFAMPIINQPQVGILGVGLIQKRPVIVTASTGKDAITIRPMVYLSFVFDHRILDGASADAFLARVKKVLETWA